MLKVLLRDGKTSHKLETIFAHQSSNKEFVPRIYKKYFKHEDKKTSHSIIRWTKNSLHCPTKLNMIDADKHIKRCSAPFTLEK